MKLQVVFFLALTTVSAAQTSPSIVNNASGPVRLVSILSKPDDMLASLTMLNTSTRRIETVSIGLIVDVPQGCSETPLRLKERVHSFQVSLDPNSSTTISDLHMSTVGIRKFLARLHGTDIAAQISIVGATYADGEKWTLTRSGKMYDDKMQALTASARCGGGTKVSYAMGGASCAKGKLVLVGQTGYNGGYYTCVAAQAQLCTNNGGSCLNTACTTMGGCPNQMCQFNSGSSVGGGGSTDDPTYSSCDTNYYFCDDDMAEQDASTQ